MSRETQINISKLELDARWLHRRDDKNAFVSSCDMT